MRQWRLHIAVVLLGLLLSACDITRNFAQNEYLLQRVKIVEDESAPRNERITSDDVLKYVRQRPNKHFLGTDFYVWVYSLANPKRDNWWNNFKRKIGEAPVILNEAETDRSVSNLKIYLDSRGYFASSVESRVDTLRNKRAKVEYTLHQGPPYRISSLSYDFQDRFLEPILQPDTTQCLIKVGDIFNVSTLEAERERIANFLLDRGYYNFSVKNISFVADTLQGNNTVGLKMVIHQKQKGFDSRGNRLLDNNMVYRLRNINIYPGYSARRDLQPDKMLEFDTTSYNGLTVLFNGKAPVVREKILRSVIPLYPNAIYDYSKVSRTYTNIMSMGYFKSVRIDFKPVPESVVDSKLITYVGHPTSASAPVHYTNEGYVDCNIYCTPSLKQGIKAELEASTTSSFYGLKAVLGYQNRNIFRGAELLEITGTVGYEYMKARDAKLKHAMEFGLAASLTFPRALIFHTSPLSSVTAPKTKFEISYNHQNRPYYRRDLSSILWTYTWRNRGHSSFMVRPIGINWVNVGYIDQNYFNSLQNEYLKHSFQSQLIVSLAGGYVYNNARTNTSGNQTIVRFNCELAGNLIDGLEHLFSRPAEGKGYYEILGIRYSQYVRADISASHKIRLGEVTAIAGRLYAGLGYAYGNSDAMPFDRMFYAGGNNSMRGWAPRTLGPGSSPAPTNVVYPTQMGDMKLEANLEFRFPIWNMFHGALFFDVGNIWYIGRDGVSYPESSVFHFNEFYKQLAFNTGLGLRIDIKFAILRLDWGLQLHNPNQPAGQRWIHNFKWKNMALNFGVGYPF